MKPITQYTQCGTVNIAYQVFGSGPIDLIYIPGWVSNIDNMWSCPELAHFLQELSKIARVILFDKRGNGLSDRIGYLSTLEERMDDIRAVMDAAGSLKAVLFGHSEGGSVSALFAATYPNRTISLITFGAYARRRYAPYYPWAPTNKERQELYDIIANNWGSNVEPFLNLFAPSKVNDPIFGDWLNAYIRSSASSGAAMKLIKMNAEVDIINILSSINVPTLIMQRTNDRNVKMDEGQFMADRIKGSKFVVLDGCDNMFWVGDADLVLNEIDNFVSTLRPKEHEEKRLFTLMTGRVISSTPVGNASWKTIEQTIAAHQGYVIYKSGANFIGSFKGPSKAAYCSMNLMNLCRNSNMQMAIGVHIQECTGQSTIEGETKTFVEKILDPAEPGKIYVTQTVRYLLAGTGLIFEPYHKVNFETLTGESIPLSTIVTNDLIGGIYSQGPLQRVKQNDFLIQQVIKIINSSLSDESFGVDMLCKELGLSERQVQRKIKAIFNKSPNQLISHVRLLKAKELLIRDHNISETAFRVGFNSPAYFSKLFKQENGLSPSNYRDMFFS